MPKPGQIIFYGVMMTAMLHVVFLIPLDLGQAYLVEPLRQKLCHLGSENCENYWALVLKFDAVVFAATALLAGLLALDAKRRTGD